MILYILISYVHIYIYVYVYVYCFFAGGKSGGILNPKPETLNFESSHVLGEHMNPNIGVIYPVLVQFR